MKGRSTKRLAIDSSVLVEAQNNPVYARGFAAELRAYQGRGFKVVIPALVLAEVENPRELLKLRIDMVPGFDEEVAQVFVSMRPGLLKHWKAAPALGRVPKQCFKMDALIYATCVHHDVDVLMARDGDFGPIAEASTTGRTRIVYFDGAPSQPELPLDE